MNKKGFTMIELILSIVLTGIILVAMVGTLLKLRESYLIINQDTEIKTYRALISKVINSHFIKNGGIKSINCESNVKCNLILGNNKTMILQITSKTEQTNIKNESNETIGEESVKYSTIRYYGDEYNYLKTIKMISDNYDVGTVINNGYEFIKISYKQNGYQHVKEINGLTFDDTITNITIEMNNPKYNIELYSSSLVEANSKLNMYILTYDNRGGHGCVEKAQYDGQRWGELCLPQKSGSTFEGWFVQPNSGDEVTEDTVVRGNLTVYARWTSICVSGDTYNTATGKCEHDAEATRTYCKSSKRATGNYTGTCSCKMTSNSNPVPVPCSTHAGCSATCINAGYTSDSGGGSGCTPTYTCPSGISGSNISGAYCYGSVADSSCPRGWEINTSIGTNGHDYSCPEGYTLSGSICSYTP